MNGTGRVQLMSKLFTTRSSVMRDKLKSKSYKLMLENGFMLRSAEGMYNLLPLGQRSVDKLSQLIVDCMESVDGQKVSCPLLGRRQLWQKTGRWDLLDRDLFSLVDRAGHHFCLQPTFEEAITEMVAVSERQPIERFPLLLYQIGDKFRDEMNPRFGLLRSRSFLMNDLYSFDLTVEQAQDTYNRVTDAYWKLFRDTLSLPIFRVRASSGLFGGTISHEFHLENPMGQDVIFVCPKCRQGVSTDYLAMDSKEGTEEEGRDKWCPVCSEQLVEMRTFEIAHTFQLGDKYSRSLDALTPPRSDDNKKGGNGLLQMCCFGMGLGRLLAASIDTLSPDDTELRLPPPLCPYPLICIPPKEGSNEQRPLEPFTRHCALWLAEKARCHILYDDRHRLTIGAKTRHAVQLGVPWIVVAGRKALSQSIINSSDGSIKEGKLEVLATKAFSRGARELSPCKDMAEILALLQSAPTPPLT